MGRSRPSVVVRQQLLLWTGIVVVALSLLILHQLSLNHTVADPSATSGSAVAAVAHVEHHEAGGGAVGDHAHLVAAVDQHPWSADGGCPGCAGHHVMALTCLAVLIFVAIGWALSGPIEWLGVRLRPLLPRGLPEPPGWRPTSLTLVELSISRT
jgi:hypothetical protein